jgi:hypothetical protein
MTEEIYTQEKIDRIEREAALVNEKVRKIRNLPEKVK